MSDYEIKKNVPIPPPCSPHNKKYPFDKMAVGDCLEVPDRTHFQVQNALSGYKARTNTQFTVRKKGYGCLVWRTK